MDVSSTLNITRINRKHMGITNIMLKQECVGILCRGICL